MDNNKSKTLLCLNYIDNKCYHYNCIFAHSLSEQIIDESRYEIYLILREKRDLTNYNLIKNDKISNIIINIMSKICNACSNNYCSGGYNCKYGAINKNYCICLKDFISGNCLDECNIHLTDYGLIPYKTQYKNQNITLPTQKTQYYTLDSNILKEYNVLNQIIDTEFTKETFKIKINNLYSDDSEEFDLSCDSDETIFD